MEGGSSALFWVSLGLILSCVVVITLFIVFVHTMPGKIAEKRGNPQAKAIEITSLLGLLVFPLWMAALVWSYLKPMAIPVAIVKGGQTPNDKRAQNNEDSLVGESQQLTETKTEQREA